MFSVDLNCDMGEGIGNDEQIMPFITSASIACGYHAGDVSTMERTVDLCIKHQVAIGAHPSFSDKENFGRREINLSPGEVYAMVYRQVNDLLTVVKTKNGKMHHVKPHGALYNMSARDGSLAAAIAKAVKDTDHSLLLYGLAGSCSLSEAHKIGLRTASEVFADRTYQDDGSLTPRKQPGALIEDTNKSIGQVLQMIREKEVFSLSGKKVSIHADTVCIHGDGKHAADFAKAIFEKLTQEGIVIKTI